MNEKRNNNQTGSMGKAERGRRAAAALRVAFRQSKTKGNNKNRGFETAGCEEGDQLAALWCDVCWPERQEVNGASCHPAVTSSADQQRPGRGLL